MTPILLTGPALEPVSLEEAKNWLRLDANTEDTLVDALITSARLRVEAVAGIQLITQEWRIVMDVWPYTACLELPTRPVSSVEAIRVFDAQGTPSTIPAEDYLVDLAGLRSRIFFHSAPVAPAQKVSGIQIDVTAGFGASPESVPGPLRQATLLLVAHWYENRGDSGDEHRTVPGEFMSLLAPWRIMRLT